jgi:DNA polymerase-3 subunit alpha (Gram-positive type)
MQRRTNGFVELLTEQVGKKTAEKLNFKRMEISTKRGEWTLFFSVTEDIGLKEKEKIKESAIRLLPGGITVNIVFEDPGAEKLTEDLIERCIRANGAAEPVLRRCKLYIEDNRLVIDTCGLPECVLDSVNAVEALEDGYYELFGKRVSAQVISAPVTGNPPYIKGTPPENKTKEPEHDQKGKGSVLMGRRIGERARISDIKDIKPDKVTATVKGRVIKHVKKELKKGTKNLHILTLADNTSAVAVKAFVKKDSDELGASIKTHPHLIVRGRCRPDDYQGACCIIAADINSYEPEKLTDTHEKKRVELHLHTNLSALDSVVKIRELIQLAKDYGHDALAVTDHGVVQAFPDLYKECKSAGIKCIYGLEAYLADDLAHVNTLCDDSRALDDLSYVVFDLETTGLNIKRDRIIEVGAVKVSSGLVIDRFLTFVNPGMKIPQRVTELTGITDDMVKDAPGIGQVLDEFNQFASGCVLVAHNATFDFGFMRQKAARIGKDFEYTVLDTLAMARLMYPDMPSHRLNSLAKKMGIPQFRHHRAESDAETASEIFRKMLGIFAREGVVTVSDLMRKLACVGIDSAPIYHATILVKDEEGLFNLYRMITESHINYYHKRPRIPKSLLQELRGGLLVGSACEQGEVYRAILDGADDDMLNDIAQFYDYLEVQPTGNNAFMLREGLLGDTTDIEDINRRICELGERLSKPVVATGDVHFLKKEDKYFRRILQYCNGYDDAEQQAPLYYRTTAEMLDEFAYLGEKKAREIVIDNTRAIAGQCRMIPPFPNDRLYTPDIPGAEQEITDMAYARARELYGDPLPEIVESRLAKELHAITKNGFAVLYLIGHKVVKKSLSDGYMVGSRGSVGSSLVATMIGITEVNPLPPHYRCERCKYTEFDIDTEKYGCGYDLPAKACPVCSQALKKEGFDIPFEVFMGFEGNKAPDIDLNFSSKYQAVVHKYIEELFGEKNVFRAGTLSTIAEKSALGYVRKYCEDKGLTLPPAEIERLALGVTDVKKSTGQHPGGMVVLPKQYDIHMFTPLQYPANDPKKGKITTHFAFSHLHDTMLKLDILGHDDPTVIRMLEDLTGKKAVDIPFDDKKVMSLFNSPKALGVTAKDICSKTGTYGIPEFGTSFVRGMLAQTRPKSFSDLVRISGLSHGTDVWANNAQELIKSGHTLSEVISTREDIMNYLIHKGMQPIDAFNIMESVRKGNVLKEHMVEKIRALDIPEWFIESCRKIKYMFPKAHAAAYVTMAYRIAYYKIYYPHEFYAVYFTVRAGDFDLKLISGGVEAIERTIAGMKNAEERLNAREKGILYMLEIALEMNKRGIEFERLSLTESAETDFLITKGKKILPPLIAITGLGEAAAQAIVAARKNGPFTSRENLIKLAQVSKSVMEMLDLYGVLDGLPATEQLSFL